MTPTDSASSPTPESPTGLWRDNGLLVVSRQRHEFPARCMKSNSSEGVSWHQVSSDPGSTLVTGFTITMGMLGSPSDFARTVQAVSDMRDRQVFLALPLSVQWYSRWRRTSRIGWTLILGGILSFIGATIAYVACMASGVPESTANLVLIPLVLAIPVAIVGLIYLSISHKPIFVLNKVTADHLWIRGASSPFLAELPAWKKG